MTKWHLLAVRAAQAAGRIKEIKIYGIGGTSDKNAALKFREMMATIQQQPNLQISTAQENAK